MKRFFILLIACLLIFGACSGGEEIIDIMDDLEPITAEPEITEDIIDIIEDIYEDSDEIIAQDMEDEFFDVTQTVDFIYEGMPQAINLVYKTVEDTYGVTELRFDIFFPTVQVFEKTPLIVGFHGGGWLAGNKSQINFMFSPIIDELRASGYAVATVQYRFASPRVIFPSPFEDCADFIIYIKENAAAYNIDPANIGVLGYSAGAHLAMLTAYAADLDIKYCVSFAGPTKLYGDDPANYSRSTMMLVENLFGGSLTEREDLYKSGSPYFYLENTEHNKTPLLLAHDRTDGTVPFSQSEIMFEKAVNSGIETEFIELRGVGHNVDFSVDGMIDKEEAMRAVLNFIYKFYTNY